MISVGPPLLRVTSAATGVLHELQKELGTTVIFLASDGQRFEAELAERRADMDHAFMALITAIEEDRDAVMVTIAAERQQVIDIMERLPEVRAQVDAREQGTAQAPANEPQPAYPGGPIDGDIEGEFGGN